MGTRMSTELLVFDRGRRTEGGWCDRPWRPACWWVGPDPADQLFEAVRAQANGMSARRSTSDRLPPVDPAVTLDKWVSEKADAFLATIPNQAVDDGLLCGKNFVVETGELE